ncbi:hypothetical protein SAMN05421503_2557 [Terribacillus aidingensis]|uniref:Uncharacterized protein n=1 Tax=Terribacillus aidingensis TaxID=586416 RepID=A0A285NZ18_9BACI|nr:hypothetical protein SAMN05421503_2557 [Terribacillus aidingensis]
MSVQAADSLTPEQIRVRKERRKLLIEELNRFGVTWDGDRCERYEFARVGTAVY